MPATLAIRLEWLRPTRPERTAESFVFNESTLTRAPSTHSSRTGCIDLTRMRQIHLCPGAPCPHRRVCRRLNRAHPSPTAAVEAQGYHFGVTVQGTGVFDLPAPALLGRGASRADRVAQQIKFKWIPEQILGRALQLLR